ncbi:hypothetical protein AXE80_09270 [Wenyingzhuangia fucanilytica]|uniref:Secretion system C-terminal sorting domain-containing protein n=1 Tax=Wenyingzhuangia fucanilytica TaxID=1790137 RepID=A0A1B1Y6T8_9FLAO|nr:T9SS type A sorting domain-containing protein [Wenyingzhuangia fucanilytica]ANW96458.1 hypothetical protein AXE80_09270 [Wenyingzhuangia fucanilytica]
MKQTPISIILIFICQALFAQTTYYVSKEIGSDSNDGLTTTTPFKTVEHAVKANNDIVHPGDTVLIMGEYTNDSYDPNFTFDFTEANSSDDTDERLNGIINSHLWHGENTIRINGVHGTPNNYITFKPYDANTVLKGDGANIFRVQNCSYLKIEGFDIEGEVERISLATAFALQFVYIDSSADVSNLTLAPNSLVVEQDQPTGNSVYYRVPPHWSLTQIEENNVDEGGPGWPLLPNISRPSYTSTRGLYVSNAHHIDVINNTVHHMPGGGIRFSEIAYSSIIGNSIHNCSRRSYGGTHALVVTKATSLATDVNISGGGDDSSSNPNDDTTHRIKINKNRIYFNYNEVYSWAPTKTEITPHLDEGKGISLQRNRTTDAPWEAGRILVSNNICYWNGFSGVHSNDGDRIDFINNTCYLNSYTNTVTLAPNGTGGNIGISVSDGEDLTIENNISVIDGGLEKYAIASNKSDNITTVANNVIWATEGSLVEDSEITGIQVNTVNADPVFVSVPSISDVKSSANPHLLTFDFHLQASSSAIDHADSNVAPSDDYDGVTRSATPEAGAYEFNVLHSDNIESIKIRVYPNPFFDEIRINTVDVKKEEIVLFDYLGKRINNPFIVVYHQNYIELNTSNLPKGMYLLKIKNVVKKVFKNRERN